MVDLHFMKTKQQISAEGSNSRGVFARIEQVNSPKISFERFALTSPFFIQLSNKLREGVDYKKRGDSLSIYLDRDQSIQLLSNDDLFGAVTFRLLTQILGFSAFPTI